MKRSGKRAASFSLIQVFLPVVTVFFELRRSPLHRQEVPVLRIDKITHHARLRSPEQIVARPQAIDTAVQRGCGNTDAVLPVMDGAGLAWSRM